MKKLPLLAILALCACAQTDNQTYFEIKQAYAAAQKVAISYKDKCAPKPDTDACHATVTQLRSADADVVDAIKEADPILIGADGSHNAAKLASLQIAFTKFNTIVTQEAK